MRSISLRLSRTLIALLMTAQILAQQRGASEQVIVESAYLRIGFGKANGELWEFTDLKTGLNFVGSAGVRSSLWQIDLAPGSPTPTIRPSQAKSFRIEWVDRDKLAARLIWDRFDIPAAHDLKVIAIVRLRRDNPTSEWHIELEGVTSINIASIRFPRVMGIASQPNEKLAVPVWMGQLASYPRTLLWKSSARIVQDWDVYEAASHRWEWPYPGTLSLQCLALYQHRGPGLFFSCDDTAAFRKAFAFWSADSGTLNYEVTHYPEGQSTNRANYSLPYDAILGTFSGDWITAAEQYRTWGTEQYWAKQSRLQRGLVPEWLLNTGMWVWNRGPSDGVTSPALVLQRELGLPVSVFWHWWHGCAYDAGFPEYLPPREGAEAFKRALARAHASNVHAIVYMNQRLWGMTTKSWTERGAERFAVKGIDGKVAPEIYNTFTNQACASMCIATPFWRNTYASIAEEAIRDLDVDGIYMDQACSSLLCYDPTHGHPLGGGTFWMKGFQLLARDIRERTVGTKDVLLAGEGSGEAWLPHLDLMLTLQVSRERYALPADGWEVIPFFQAVYHEYGVTYGNYSSLSLPPYDELWPAEFAPLEPLKLLEKKYSQQFFLEQARSFAWGVQPTIANFLPQHLEERAEETGYMIKLSKIRYGALKYLLYGTFLRPPRVRVPEIEIDLSRLSIYAGQREGVRSGRNRYPAVVTGAWKARDGNVGIALVSISRESISLSLDLTEYSRNDHERLYWLDESGRRAIGWQGGQSIPIVLPPLGACIIEMTNEGK